jgi:hypothetical protein
VNYGVPIVLKTPACPTVVSLPPSTLGHWDAAISSGLRALFVDRAVASPAALFCRAVLPGRMALAAVMPNLSV